MNENPERKNLRMNEAQREKARVIDDFLGVEERESLKKSNEYKKGEGGNLSKNMEKERNLKRVFCL